MFDSTLEDFVANSAAHVLRLKQSREPETLTIDGQPELVVLDVEVFEEMKARLEEAELVESLRQAHRDYEDGKARPLRVVMEEIRTKHGL